MGKLAEAVQNDWSDLDKVKGSAAGARIGGFLWGAASSGLFLALGSSSFYWWVGLPVYTIAIVSFVRSFFLGVWVGDHEVLVVSWFRKRRFVEGQVRAVEKSLYFGAGGAGVGWLPFVGSIRMIEVETTTGRLVHLPSTVGRRNGVLRLARQMRSALGLSPR